MLRTRAQFVVGLIGAIAAAILERPLKAIFKAIFDVTVQDYWKDTASPFLLTHVGPWSATMLEWFTPFWGGVASAFGFMFLVEMAFAWRRTKKKPLASSDGPDESGVEWYFKKPNQHVLNMTQTGNDEALISGLGFGGINRRKAPIDKISGYVKSLVTNREIPLMLGAEGLLYAPSDTYGVPVSADFGVAVSLPRTDETRPGMIESRFRIEFSRFVFHIELDGEKYDYHFTKEMMDKYFENFYFNINFSDKPRVIRKPGAQGKMMGA